jgi:hypothetical protein
MGAVLPWLARPRPNALGGTILAPSLKREPTSPPRIEEDYVMIPSTTERVQLNTAEQYNAQIRRQTEQSVARCAEAGLDAIDRRLEELDREWDIERTLEANAATAVLAGVALGATVDRKFFFFPAIVGGFLLQHAVQGWCPPLPLFRWLGVRTQGEIEEERYALKALRGDFREQPPSYGRTQPSATRQAIAAVRR